MATFGGNKKKGQEGKKDLDNAESDLALADGELKFPTVQKKEGCKC